MKISKVEIKNYRNLDGVTVHLADDCNFIVGENNLGKSNLLALFDIVFCRRSFSDEDFKDRTKPIEVTFKLKLSDLEIGHFQDLFDPKDPTTISILCRQADLGDNIEFFHVGTNASIHPSIVRCINYVHYDSLRNPITEINFDRDKGVGRFLGSLISRYLADSKTTNKDFLEQTKVAELAKSVNDKLVKIKSFKDFAILAVQDDDLESLLSRVLILKDADGGRLTKAGYGVQFLILVTLSILEEVQSIIRRRRDKGIFENEATGERAMSLILGFDEPEVHLHPYIQRSLVKYLVAVINNRSSDFGALIKDLFDIDSFIGQIIVVTQSPNIILNDYHQVIRFCTERGTIKTISGTELKPNPSVEKHLYLNFPFFKEAFFSRCAIFVEGDSEYGSLPLFARKLSDAVDFDDLGICVIQAHGSSIPQLLAVGSLYNIPCVGLTDRDSGLPTPATTNHFVTDLRNFEEELVSLIDSGKEATLRKILVEYDPRGVDRELQRDALNKWAVDKYSVVTARYTTGLKLADIPATDSANLRAYYLTWLSINKSYTLARLIGEMLSETEIPKPYTMIIKEAVKLARNV